MSATTLEQFFCRVDAHRLELGLGSSEDTAFLETLRDQWIGRYENFQARVDRGQPSGTLGAFDYLQTISGLDQRIANSTRDGLADLSRWQRAYRKSAGYRALAEGI